MEGAVLAPHGWAQLDSREHRPASSAAIGERRDAGGVRQDLLALRSQRREPPPVVQQREAEPVTPEPYADVAPVDEAQGEKTPPEIGRAHV